MPASSYQLVVVGFPALGDILAKEEVCAGVENFLTLGDWETAVRSGLAAGPHTHLFVVSDDVTQNASADLRSVAAFLVAQGYKVALVAATPEGERLARDLPDLLTVHLDAAAADGPAVTVRSMLDALGELLEVALPASVDSADLLLRPSDPDPVAPFVAPLSPFGPVPDTQPLSPFDAVAPPPAGPSDELQDPIEELAAIEPLSDSTAATANTNPAPSDQDEANHEPAPEERSPGDIGAPALVHLAPLPPPLAQPHTLPESHDERRAGALDTETGATHVGDALDNGKADIEAPSPQPPLPVDAVPPPALLKPRAPAMPPVPGVVPVHDLTPAAIPESSPRFRPPAAAGSIADRLGMRSAPAHQRPRPPRSRAKANAFVIAVFSGKGGVGKTSLTANLAVTMATEFQHEEDRQRPRRTIAFDGNIGQGDIDIHFGMDGATNTLSDLVQRPFVTPEVLKKYLHRYNDLPLWALLASDMPHESTPDVVSPDKLKQVVAALRVLQGVDYILIDCPPATSGGGIALFNEFVRSVANYFLVVVEPSASALEKNKLLMDYLAASKGPDGKPVSTDRVGWVLNKYTPMSGMTESGIRDRMEPFAHLGTFAADDQWLQLHNTGHLIAREGLPDVRRTLREIAFRITREDVLRPPPAPTGRASGGWFRRRSA